MTALKAGQIRELIIAEDADRHILDELLLLAEEARVPIVKVDSMKKLGKACGIDVGAATVAIRG
jgi:large subunit ribosomal protein L7A